MLKPVWGNQNLGTNRFFVLIISAMSGGCAKVVKVVLVSLISLPHFLIVVLLPSESHLFQVFGSFLRKTMVDLAQEFGENTINEPVSETIFRDLRLVRSSPISLSLILDSLQHFHLFGIRLTYLIPCIRMCCFAVGRPATSDGRNPVNQSCKQQSNLLCPC